MASQDTFQCSVVTPERAVLECEARFVAFPSHDGELGIMRGRAPLLCRVGIGRMRAETADGEHVLFIDGGFAQMVDNKLTILTEQAKAPAEIDQAAAKKALADIQLTTFEDEKAYRDHQAAKQRARVQIELAE